MMQLFSFSESGTPDETAGELAAFGKGQAG
jgi:hypothetical protein